MFRLSSGTEARKLPGVGEKIAAKVEEILSTGQLAKLERIHEDGAATAINLLTRVSGIGTGISENYAVYGHWYNITLPPMLLLLGLRSHYEMSFIA